MPCVVELCLHGVDYVFGESVEGAVDTGCDVGGVEEEGFRDEGRWLL